MKPWLLYTAVLLAYLPGLIAILKLDQIGRLPVVLFCFLGLFVINALGSILVLFKEYSFSGVPLVSVEYLGILVGQALLFYLVTGPYVLIKSHPILGQPKIQKADRALVAGLVAGAILIIFLFYYKVGGFLIVDLLSGELNARTMPQYRAKKSTGVEGFLVYRFGFLVLPSIVASILTMLCLLEQRIRVTRGILILLCFIAPLLLSDKAGILLIALVMLITYVSFLGVSGKTVIQAVNAKVILALAAAFVPTLFIITAYYGEGHTILDNLTLLGFRIFGAHSESLAGIVAMVNERFPFFMVARCPRSMA